MLCPPLLLELGWPLEALGQHSQMSPPQKRKPQPVVGEDPVFFNFSATLRIYGEGLDLEELSRTLGLEPTHAHRKGESRAPGAPPYLDDLWGYQPAIPRDRPLHEHIMALWVAVQPHILYLRSLKSRFKVDVFCGYRTNSVTAGFEVDHRCLGLFAALEVPFGVSVIIS